MTLSNADREVLKKYRIELAHEAIQDAELLIGNNKLRGAVNRIYYGIFYILNALALKYEFKTSKHQGIIAWFNKTLVWGRCVRMCECSYTIYLPFTLFLFLFLDKDFAETGKRNRLKDRRLIT